MLANVIAIVLCLLLGAGFVFFRYREYRAAAQQTPDETIQRRGVLVKLRLRWTFALLGRAKMTAWFQAEDGSTAVYQVPTLQIYHSLKKDVPGTVTCCRDYLLSFEPDTTEA
ncbi:MAG: hypothetical protein IJ751_10060 [Oscillospiraceae bacterium]|nr:hypothetical protein [Oscillospiraceae bacterium]